MVDTALSIYNGEPVSSLFGTMFFPNDRAKAETWATAFLARAVADLPAELIESIPAPEIQSLLGHANQYAGIAAEARKAAYAGTQVGTLVSVMWHAHHSDSRAASWNDACATAEKLGGLGLAGVRSSLLRAKSDFSLVLHFWAVLSIECANRWPLDIKLFIAQSAALLREMRRLETQGIIGGRSFSSPKLYVPVAALNWPSDGIIKVGKIVDRLSPESKKRPGRPKKIPVQK